MATQRRAKAEAGPRFEVLLNGKRLAIAGVDGQGNLYAHLHWSRTEHYGEGPWANGGLRLWVAGGDFNDPIWDRFRRWVDRPLGIGDRVEFRIVEGPPDPGRPLPRSRRIPVDQYPSRRNPTAVRVRGAKLWALEEGVLLCVGERFQGTAQLSPNAARRLARGLARAAEAIERRQEKRPRAGRRREGG